MHGLWGLVVRRWPSELSPSVWDRRVETSGSVLCLPERSKDLTRALALAFFELL